MMGRNKGSEEREEERLGCKTEGARSSGDRVLLRIISLCLPSSHLRALRLATPPVPFEGPYERASTAAMSHERVAIARRRGEVEKDFIAQYPGMFLSPSYLTFRHWDTGQLCGSRSGLGI